jgi:hypothetical protein
MQPGIQLYSATLTTSGSLAGTFVYCGNVNAVDLYVACSGASVHGAVNVRWALDSAGVTTLPQINQYVVNNTITPAITDCLPVLAPWVKVDVFSLDGLSATFAALITSALQTVRGATTLLNNGVCINFGASVGAGVNATAYGNYVSPGTYSWAATVSAALTGSIRLFNYNGTTGFAPIVFLWNPQVNTAYGGLVVLGTMQPVALLANSGGAAVTVTFTLEGPAL